MEFHALFFMNPKLDEVREWLQKAEQDQLSARILLERDLPVLFRI
jgi:hypothetical protein